MKDHISKLRIAAGVGLGAIGVSVAGSLMPAVASASPYVPDSGHSHPVRHYAANFLNPGWAITHPFNSALP